MPRLKLRAVAFQPWLVGLVSPVDLSFGVWGYGPETAVSAVIKMPLDSLV